MLHRVRKLWKKWQGISQCLQSGDLVLLLFYAHFTGQPVLAGTPLRSPHMLPGIGAILVVDITQPFVKCVDWSIQHVVDLLNFIQWVAAVMRPFALSSVATCYCCCLSLLYHFPLLLFLHCVNSVCEVWNVCVLSKIELPSFPGLLNSVLRTSLLFSVQQNSDR